jgi:hypothetical protein
MTVGGVTNQVSTWSAAQDETGVFWVDLSSQVAGNLIDGVFSLAVESEPLIMVATSALPEYLPAAKLGGGNYVYVTEINGTNYFGVERVLLFNGEIWGSVGMTVAQAYSIDKKIDDGLPTTGSVAAMVNNDSEVNWALGGNLASSDTYVPSGSVFSGIVGTAGNASSSLTCFDAATGSTPAYSMEQNNGAGLNCALIFQF